MIVSRVSRAGGPSDVRSRRRSGRGIGPALMSLVLSAATTAMRADAANSGEVKALLANPPRQFTTAPLWVWNDMLTDEEVLSSLRDLAAQNVRQAFVHPRPGLMTPYLSDEWFRLWKLALKEAEKLDMNIWIYDENSYPSGFAGGWVPRLMPEARGRGLHMREEKTPPTWQAETVAVFRKTETGFENVSAAVQAGTATGEGTYLTFFVNRAKDSPWNGGGPYVDLLLPGVTQKFIEVTHEAYKREVGPQFGKRIPGVFTDEPELQPAGGLPWTDDLAEQFRKRWGYSLIDNLPALRQPLGDWRKVRHNYFQLLHELFVERWAKPVHDWCAKNNLEFTGHYWDHDWPYLLHVPDSMAMYAWHQRPAIDQLLNQYNEGVQAQFGNVRMVRELSSVANQLEVPRTLCETYGASGWDLRFEDMKRIGDWLFVLGINTMNQHISNITIRGARKRDHPPVFSYQEPWWEAYHTSATYFARLSAALSHGRQFNSVLVIEPTTTAWMHNTEGGFDPEAGRMAEAFQKLLLSLEAAQVEYDLGCEQIIAAHGTLARHVLGVGKRYYTDVVIPPLTENLNTATVDLLARLLRGGGSVLCCGEPPAYVDGAASDRCRKLAGNPRWRKVEPGALPGMLKPTLTKNGVSIARADGDKGILFHHRRVLDDGELLFLVNTSLTSPSAGTVESRLKSVERWDLETGRTGPYPFEKTEPGCRMRFDLPPCGSLLVFLGNRPAEPAPPVVERVTTIAAAGAPEIRRVDPNVLVIDYVDVTAGGETKKDLYFFQAADFAFKKNGLAANPWSTAVQYRDEIISKTFPAGSGFEASYRFTIAERVPPSLEIVIELADRYTITCNGKAVAPVGNAWWIDRAFRRVDIGAAAQVGENVVTIKASPMTVFHELEPAYVIGDFSLKAADKGFVIVPAQPLRPGRWNELGCPLYGHKVSYAQKFNVASPAGRYRVSLPAWYGSVARVLVNGKPAGCIGSAPWKCDVTEHIRAGENAIEVIVIGTLKNTLGPHHGNPPLGIAGPFSFVNAPQNGPPAGNAYSTVGYGLFEPFELECVGGT